MAADEDVPRPRPTRITAGSLARFRYRENSDSDDASAGTRTKTGAKNVKEESFSDSDEHVPQDDDSSLSELSLASDVSDAPVPKRRTTTRRTAKTTTTTTSKRKRASTTTTVTALPTHKKRSTVADVADGRAMIKREIKDEEEDSASAVLAATAERVSPRKARRPARVITSRVKHEDETASVESASVAKVTTVEPPTDWELFYDLVKTMRQPGGPAANAAVDTMGCERLALPTATPRERRFHTLVALMLSSQTKDTVTAVVMDRLQRELPPHTPGAAPGLTLDNMLAVDADVLNQMIWQVGFHNNKTRYLKQAAVIMRDQWGGDIPPTAEALMALPGVGPKMAYLCLSAEHGWNRVEGIGVDVHVHRITNLWGWQKPGSPQAKTPEATRLALQSWLPRDKWKEINWLLVGFGQAVCLPQGAKCGDCTLGLRGLCPAANRKKVNEGRQRRIALGQDMEDLFVDHEVKLEVKDEVKDEVKLEVKDEIEQELDP